VFEKGITPHHRGHFKVTTAQKVEAVKDWIAENPLRVKRESIGASKDHAAVLMGVAVSSIKTWEVGAHFPREAAMERIASFLEVSVDEARGLWEKWWNNRPGQSELTDDRLYSHGALRKSKSESGKG
jgi:DNA-binding transcriptional regulator YiaG